MMKYSIIVPVYNVEKYITRCVTSILNQTYENLEIILVDDGSPDRCPEICDEFQKRDSRVKVIHKENGGPSDARNVGIRNATGDYLLFVDSDDSLCDRKAILQIDNFLSSNDDVDVLFTDWDQNVNAVSGKELLNEYFSEKRSFRIAVWDKVYCKKFLIDNNLFFECGYVHEDSLWTIQVLFHAEKCMGIDCPYYQHNTNEESIVNNPSQMAIYKRAVGKIHNSKIGIDYFHTKTTGILSRKINGYFFGMFNNGLATAKGITDKYLKEEYNKELNYCLDVLSVGRKSDSVKYKMIAACYCLIGKKIIPIIEFCLKLLK